MNGSDASNPAQQQEARLWLARAAEDGRAAAILLTNGLSSLAAFHVQQATEKALKGLLVAAAQDIRRVHDIGALAEFARTYWPDLLPSPFQLTATNQWYTATRYPGIDEDAPPIAEVEEALRAIEALMGAISGRILPG